MEWYLKTTENGTYTQMPVPAKFSIDGEDLDLDSYRSIVNGNIQRNVLGFKWQKAEFEFAFKNETDAMSLVSTLQNTYPIYLKFSSPLMNNVGYVELTGYVSRIHAEYVAAWYEDGWVVSFNFVEGTR